MKKSGVFIALFLLLAGIGQAQKITGVRFSYFLPARPDTFQAGNIPNMIKAGGYQGYLVQENFVSENPKTAAKLIALIKNLKANGSEDISKCFIPRHAVTMLNGNDVVYHVLVCFECDGVRFTNEKKTTKIKNAAKREVMMRSLKKYFNEFHFNENGIQLEEE